MRKENRKVPASSVNVIEPLMLFTYIDTSLNIYCLNNLVYILHNNSNTIHNGIKQAHEVLLQKSYFCHPYEEFPGDVH